MLSVAVHAGVTWQESLLIALGAASFGALVTWAVNIWKHAHDRRMGDRGEMAHAAREFAVAAREALIHGKSVQGDLVGLIATPAHRDEALDRMHELGRAAQRAVAAVEFAFGGGSRPVAIANEVTRLLVTAGTTLEDFFDTTSDPLELSRASSQLSEMALTNAQTGYTMFVEDAWQARRARKPERTGAEPVDLGGPYSGRWGLPVSSASSRRMNEVRVRAHIGHVAGTNVDSLFVKVTNTSTHDIVVTRVTLQREPSQEFLAKQLPATIRPAAVWETYLELPADHEPLVDLAEYVAVQLSDGRAIRGQQAIEVPPLGYIA